MEMIGSLQLLHSFSKRKKQVKYMQEKSSLYGKTNKGNINYNFSTTKRVWGFSFKTLNTFSFLMEKDI